MAISKIKKIEILGLERDRQAVLLLLQKLGCLEIIDVSNKIPQIQETPSDKQLLEIEEAITYLGGLRDRSGTFTSLIRTRARVFAEELEAVISHFDYLAVLEELSCLRNQLKEIQREEERLLQERNLLTPWQNLDLLFEELHPTRNCAVLLGILPLVDYRNLLVEDKDSRLSLFWEIVHQDKKDVYLAVFYLLKEFTALEIFLKEHHFNFISLPPNKGTIKQRCLEIGHQLKALDEKKKDIKNRIYTLRQERVKLMLVYDYFFNLKDRQEAEEKLSRQQFSFYLAGWIKAKEEKFLTEILFKNFKDIAIFLSEPKDEEPPVALDNPRIIQPFEFITQIYGMPKYKEIDPTPFLAPFFFLYFGLCVSDAGYGMLLILFCWFMLKKFRLGPQGLKFFRLFLSCGISTIIFGILTGSWFGNSLDIASESVSFFVPLKKIKDTLTLLEPLREPTKLLGLALLLGIIQVWFGNIVAGISNLKNRRYKDILFDQLNMLIFLFGITGLGFIFLNLVDKQKISLFKYAALIGGLGILLTQGRQEKTIGAKLFYGLFTLYNCLSGYLSDILSYSRLWALGLVTGVMANTINLLSLQFTQIITSFVPALNKLTLLKVLFSGIILSIIFLFGHLVSFLMNLLGAFVHPLRLQFVEFFSKFFKTTGTPFRPLKIETKYTDLT
ncbi:MAG: V-type ATP synthase subunit I [Candidatus Omnitrophica bacterium]|nr:V-type ATP synthase subunit I [Candidatus Omnitrophota bacterium]